MNAISPVGQQSSYPTLANDAARSLTIQHGDSLSALAAQLGVPLDKLLAANPQILNPDVIYPGDQLNVPDGASAAQGGGDYTVQAGDTLSGIAGAHGLSLQSLTAANPQISNPDLILIGDRIQLPGGPSPGTGGAPDASPGPVEGAAPTAPVDPGGNADGVTPAQLQQIVPQLSASRAEAVAPHLNAAMAEANIDTPQRQAMFIAQLAHESGGFHYMEEIASGAAYEGRADLGNTQPGDGERYKGRGYIQVTGRHNYTEAGRALGLDLVNNPELAAQPENAARIAAWYWESRGINAAADSGDFTQVTRMINGGTNGLADRQDYYARAQAALD